jgi:peptidoglycan/LPS O-acetylase OafA/YrhL
VIEPHGGELPKAHSKLDGVQVLRAVAALAVVVFHCHWTGVASFGVELFFVISGFIICHAASQNPKRFLAKRVARVVPLYWSATLGVAAIALVAPALAPATQLTAANLLRSLAFWPYSRADGADMPILFLGWTLNYEVFFYALFAASLAISDRLAPYVTLALLIAAVSLHDVIAPLGNPLDFWTRPILLNFACGIIVWLAWRGSSVSLRQVPLAIAASVALAVCGVLLIGAHHGIGGTLPFTGMLCGTLVLALLSLSHRVRWPATLMLIGDASYSLYLLHPFVVEIVNRKIYPFGPSMLGALSTFGAILAAIAIAVVAFRVVERPSNRALRRITG